MITFKRCLLLFVFVAMLAIPSVAWWYWPTRLPHPDQCDREQLFRWIALRDVSTESVQTQRALVRQFQDLLLSDPSTVNVAIDPAYRPRVDHNRALLQDLWFYDRVAEYDQLEVSQRPEFLDRQLRTAIQWQALKRSDPAITDVSGGSPISRVITHWVDSAKDAETHQQVVAVLAAATMRWLATNDVESLSDPARRSFATELFQQFQREDVAGVLAESVTVDIRSTESDQLLRNGELLLEAWFYEQARIYHELGGDEDRRKFLQDKVAAVRQSPLLTMLTSSGKAQTSPWAQILKIQQMIQSWIRRADESDRHMLQEFSNAVYREVIAGFTRS